ncbi:MAG: PfkB family carbohydrate kinase [Bacteroidota bacterium]
MSDPKEKIIISGTGCALVDYLYSGIGFNTPAFEKYRSKTDGDGGISPGKLVFTEEVEEFSGKAYPEILKEISGDQSPDAINVGGPGLVSMIHAAQMLDPGQFEVRFYGGMGRDEAARQIRELSKRTPLDISNYLPVSNRATPFTHVLSDASYDNHRGERTFVNHIGAAWDYTPDMLGESFFHSDIVCFGGTALMPRMHDSLSVLLQQAKQKECLTVVNTVYDFRNEKNKPGEPWPLCDSKEDFGMIDLLLMDGEEARRISGYECQEDSARFFIEQGVHAFIITNGPEEMLVYSDGTVIQEKKLSRLPVSGRVAADLQKTGPEGDTTGCGDNFAGGALASLAWQMQVHRNSKPDFDELIAWAVASGGFACFYLGGTYFEESAGEKRSRVESYKLDYTHQISHLSHSSPPKLVLFGAGKIGRSFIASLFSKGGYEVVFIDIDKNVIEALNQKRSYKVIIKEQDETEIRISGVRGVLVSNEEEVITEIAEASIMAVSVGMRGLAASLPLIARGILRRYQEEPDRPLDIIIAENIRNGAEYVRAELGRHLPEWFPLDELVGLVETSIGKMVPIMPEDEREKDVLQVFAESYCTLIVDRQGFRNPIPGLKGLAPKTSMKAWVDRKLFVHNLGHAGAAYYGYDHYPELTYMYEVLEHTEAREFTRQLMLQSSRILQAIHPDVFTDQQLEEHIDDLIARFRNRALGDTVYRVGCDLQRKLSAEDRIMAPLHAGIRLGIPVDRIAEALFYGTRFKGTNEMGELFPGDAEFHQMAQQEGLESVLVRLGNLDRPTLESLS